MRILLTILGLLLLATPSRAGEYRLGTSHWMDIDSSTSAAMTNGVGEFTQHIRIVCTEDCYFALAASGQSAEAAANSTTSAFLPADLPEQFIIDGGGKVAVIATSTSGKVTITELSK